METKRSKQLTWADVKVGDVYIDVDGDACWRSAYNESTHHTDGVCGYDKDTVVIRVIGPMNPDWIDWDRGYIAGFTIPDEVMESEPQGKPAVEFERVNVGHNDTPEDDAVGELIEYVWKEWKSQSGGGDNRVTYDLKELQSRCSKARDQYGQQQAAKRDALSIAETILKQRREAIEKYIQSYLEKTGRKIEELEMCIQRQDNGGETYSLIPRDSDFKIKEPVPTIPQEVMKCLEHFNECFDGFHRIHIVKGDASYNAIQDALRVIKDCEVAKPHPLTKVRELVEWAVDAGHHFGEAARRELQECDGEVGDE